MPELLLEIFSEEIPARMQAQAGRDLERLAREHLAKAGLAPDSLTAHAGPRRLTLVAELAAATPDRTEELKGPRANAPEQALEGFLRKTGLARDQLTERDGVFFATLATHGRATADIVAEMVPAIMAAFPWPKSMRSGASSFRWVRPLKRILCLFDGKVVPLEAGGVQSGDLTEGHRFLGANRAPFAVTGFADYAAKLRNHFVVLEQAERKRLILDGARAVCAAEGLELVEDEGLLEEVSGLSEWPFPILGQMDSAFLDLPPEVIRTSMRTHQKYFAVRDPRTGALAPRFVVVANVEPTDGGAVIAAGNAKVLSARLSDARFFWEQDTAPGSFEKWLKKLEGVTFHAKLGTMAERVARIEALAREIAPLVGADVELAGIAARYCKADLASGMVGEFPELQGVMGGYYWRAGDPPQSLRDSSPKGRAAEAPAFPIPPPLGVARRAGGGNDSDLIANAIRDHYKPVGPSDSVPTAPVTVAVALADKLDTLVGFFAIDEKPTGSKDPYALRRAALGILRVLLVNGIRLPLKRVVHPLFARWFDDPASWARAHAVVALDAFFADRLKVLLRDEGKRHDLVDAVFALGDDDLVRITRRVEALSDFLESEDGANLLAGYKRATNILKAEEKKNLVEAESYKLTEQLGALTTSEEQALAAALRTEVEAVDAALEAEDFTRAMRHLAHLRAPVDAFFDKVLVNDPDPAVRLTRLRLLTQVRDTANRVADFSLISG
jgi:glycyl-tRNA synthetase beta chain